MVTTELLDSTTKDRPAAVRPSSFQRALAEWAHVLGAAHVSVDGGALDRYAATTGTRGHRPTAALYPATTAEVQAVVEIAARHGQRLHPISRGKNWGYGDACPPGEGQVLLDLRRMNRIVEVDERLCYAVIQPGVTQRQLFDHLATLERPLWMDVTGAGDDASIVGNALERGFGHTRYGDHVLTSCGLEVVLGDGRVLRTGYGHYANARAHRVYRYGVGPSLDGLFSQSSLGVVTEMGVWLMPRPECFRAFFFSADRDEDLGEVIERLAPLRLGGLLQSAIHIANDLRVVSGRRRYPFDRTGGRTPLPREVREELRRELGIGAWNACGAIYGTRATVAATQSALRAALGRRFRLAFVDDARLAFLERLLGWLRPFGLGRWLAELLRTVKPMVGILRGEPTNAALPGAAWRVRAPDPEVPVDPVDARAGLLWVSPILPARGDAAREVMGLLEPIYDKHGFETLVTFTMINERALTCITNVAFDRSLPDECERAAACYDELLEVLVRAGYVPYRASPSGMARLRQSPDTFWDVTRDLKRALDPAGVLSAGRY